MRHRRLKLSAILLLGLGLSALHAQESLNTTGGNASGTGGSVSYSVGQVMFTNSIGVNGSVLQGVQHPYEIWVVSAKDEAIAKYINLSVYPNPTVGSVTLLIEESGISGFSYQLYDVQGNILQSERITATQTSISMSSLVPATYFVRVTKDNKEVKTFKIIKN